MNLEELPGLRLLVDAGPNDRIFDRLLLLGPIVILFVAILGRSIVTMGLAASYLLVLLGYILYRAVS